MKDPGPFSALLVALTVGVLYTQGGVYQVFAALIILAVLLTPIEGNVSRLQPNSSLLAGMIGYLNRLLTEGIGTGV